MNLTTRFTQILKPNVSPSLVGQTAWAILRTVVGIMMMHNGFDKLADIPGFATAYVEVIGLPFPLFFSYIAAFTEVIAAPLVAIGLLTRPAALGLFGTMCVAIYHHILVAGFNLPYLELSAVYAACFLFLAVNGGGLFSTDAWMVNWLDATALTQQAKRLMRLEQAFQSSIAPEATEKVAQ